MKKTWPYLLGVVLVAVAVGLTILAINGSKVHDDNAVGSNSSEHKTLDEKDKKACSIFTLADAKILLGDTAKGGELSPVTISKDMYISACAYKQDDGSNTPVTSSKSAALKVNFPKTAIGTTSNQNQFGTLKPVNTEKVDGYGQSAYWDSVHGQLNILKNNTWYVLSYGPVTPADRTLDETKQLADLLINKL